MNEFVKLLNSILEWMKDTESRLSALEQNAGGMTKEERRQWNESIYGQGIVDGMERAKSICLLNEDTQSADVIRVELEKYKSDVSALEHPEPDKQPSAQPAEIKEVNLSCEFDAAIWVKEWMRVIKEHPQIPTDANTMIGWFANAIMAGYDRAKNEKPAETERGWIPFDGHVWVAWSDGTVNDDIVEDPAPYGASGKATPTHIMPYHPGDKKPEPPKGDKL